MTLKEFSEMKMISSDESLRGRFCAKLFNDLLLRIVGQLGSMPSAAYLALRWEDGTKFFIAAKDAQSAGEIQADIMRELQTAFELGARNIMEAGQPCPLCGKDVEDVEKHRCVAGEAH
jgi:hypothetical protein